METTKKKLPLTCPSCGTSLCVKQLHCPGCETEVTGSFELPLLARFPEKDQEFILNFVKSSGSLKDMARNMGISYPTVRNLLDEIIEKLTKMED